MRAINFLVSTFFAAKYAFYNLVKRGSGIRPAVQPCAPTPQLVVSLTSYPQRFPSVFLTIESLLNQTYQPDRIILWLSREDVQQHALPARLTKLTARGLEIRLVEENLKPYKKLIYALQEFKHSPIVVCDDDMMYPKWFLAKLYRAYQNHPDCVAAYRCRVMRTVDGRLTPYADWPLARADNHAAPSYALFPTGNSGILYPPGCLDARVAERVFMQLAPLGDDIWFKAMSLLRRTKVVLVTPRSMDFPSINLKDSQKNTLWQVNAAQNDGQLQRVFAYFDLHEFVAAVIKPNPPTARATHRQTWAWRWRRLTWRLRAAPNFMVIGAMKSGTSSMHANLAQHPSIRSACKKEVHFFDGGLHPNSDNFAKGENWYRAHFPIRSARRQAFEASPLYLYHPLAAERIFQSTPQARLIALLRNPTERAISHYFHAKRAGHESLPIMDALLAEEERLGLSNHGARAKVAASVYPNANAIHHSYKQRGIYHQQLTRFLQYFPREQLLVLSSEEFFRAPGPTLQRVFEFIGVNPQQQLTDLVPRNATDPKPPVERAVIAYLDDYFAAHNQRLYALIGQPFGW